MNRMQKKFITQNKDLLEAQKKDEEENVMSRAVDEDEEPIGLATVLFAIRASCLNLELSHLIKLSSFRSLKEHITGTVLLWEFCCKKWSHFLHLRMTFLVPSNSF